MSFDKTRALRNAEKFLSQGKIGLAIGEYRQIVASDPRDFATMNMLGDLHVKNAETNAAVDCYRAVAEHYGKQGFAQKAIAIYNKIARINPHSPEVMERLAALYKEKGSIKESKSQYEQLAAHYERAGKKLEALETWKHIAELDPNNADAFVTVGEGFLAEGSSSDAAAAFAEAAIRFAKVKRHDMALTAFDRSFAIAPPSSELLAQYVDTAFESGEGAVATRKVSELRDENKHDRELHSLLIDCLVRTGDYASAEASLVELLEHDPACYPKLVELSRFYMNDANASAAARVLAMASEHMLMDGRAEELKGLVAEVLETDDGHIDALRMLVRCCSWLKDESGFRDALTRLASAAGPAEAVEDERWALSQLVMIAPHESNYTERLKELNLLLGIEEEVASESLFDKRFVAKKPTADAAFDAPEVENFVADAEIVETTYPVELETFAEEAPMLATADVLVSDSGPALEKEIESIKFYIENGYRDIAVKAISELVERNADPKVIAELNALLTGDEPVVEANPEPVPAANVSVSTSDAGSISGTFDLSELRSELGLDDGGQESIDDDFETHYNTAVAYKEMHLLEEAIKEFQQAIALVGPSDPSRRFFQCANLLGHCFMQLGRPNLAVRWFLRTLETSNISDDERLGIWYELAVAYEADGDSADAARYFEQVYAENINFRDVAERVNSLIAAV